MIIYLKNKHTLQVDNFYFKCSIGKNGLTKKKIEGDKKTPIGSFKISHLYYRKDRVRKPQTQLSCISIEKDICFQNICISYMKILITDKTSIFLVLL